MSDEKLLRALEREWDLEDGFLGGLRLGHFDAEGLARLEALLADCPAVGEPLSRRIVALVWYIPLFTLWQRERVLLGGRISEAEYIKMQGRLTSLVENCLGVP